MDKLSVEWQGGAVEQGDPGLARAAAFASVLARTLAAAGYQPRQLTVSVQRAAHGVLQLNVSGNVPGITEADFESVARATLNGVSARLGLALEGDLVLVARLESSVSVEPPVARPVEPPVARPVEPPVAPPIAPHPPQPAPKPRDWSLYGRLAVGMVSGLLLGVLGLPRVELSLPKANVLPTPSTSVVETLARQEDPTPLPATPTATVARAVPTAIVRLTPSNVLFAERLVMPLADWTNDPHGMAWFADGEYRLFARDPGRFVAAGVPLREPVRDARLTAQFHKSGGPAGGGYGLIIRDQGATVDRDSRNQAGQYLVLEIGDRGDFGVWQRDRTRWIDVVPWTHSEAVHQDRAANALTVTTQGSAVRFEVNGVLVTELNYDRLPPNGGVGIFVGGDLNEVALEWLRIENL